MNPVLNLWLALNIAATWRQQLQSLLKEQRVGASGLKASTERKRFRSAEMCANQNQSFSADGESDSYF
jgi:hypothetical protein